MRLQRHAEGSPEPAGPSLRLSAVPLPARGRVRAEGVPRWFGAVPPHTALSRAASLSPVPQGFRGAPVCSAATAVLQTETEARAQRPSAGLGRCQEGPQATPAAGRVWATLLCPET